MKTTKKTRALAAAASLILGAGGFAVLCAGSAHAATAGNLLNPATLPDLGTCAPMTPGYSIEDDMPDQVPCVGALQESLAAVGFGSLQPDGLYGQDTWQAVWCFQSFHQLGATGDADAQTIVLLDEVANSPAAMTSDNGASLQAPAAPAIPVTVNGQVELEAPDVTVPDDDDEDVIP